MNKYPELRQIKVTDEPQWPFYLVCACVIALFILVHTLDFRDQMIQHCWAKHQAKYSVELDSCVKEVTEHTGG